MKRRYRRPQGYYWVKLAGWPGLAFIGYWAESAGVWSSFAGYSGATPRVTKVLGHVLPPPKPT